MSSCEDVRKKPSNMSINVDTTKMLHEWKKQMDHEVPIHACGPCGRKIFITDEDLILMPFTHKLLKCCKANKQDLPTTNGLRYKSLHLVKHGTDTSE